MRGPPRNDLQQPVEHDRDLAEEERAVDVRRQQHVVDHQQRHGQHRHGPHDGEHVGQRNEPPLGLVQTEIAVDEPGIDDEGRQHDQQEPPALGEEGILEPDEEARQDRRRRREEVVRQNEPHPRRELRKPDHDPRGDKTRPNRPLPYRPFPARATACLPGQAGALDYP